MNFFINKCINIIFILLIIFLPGNATGVDHAIHTYRKTLPTTESVSKSLSIGRFITNFLVKFCPHDTALEGIDSLSKKIDHIISEEKELKIYLPGFPFKSINRTKCISNSPDLGEYLALITLEHIAATIAAIYPYISITIISDGYPYKTIVDPTDDEIKYYHDQLKVLVSNFPHLNFQDGLSLGGGSYSPEDLRAAVACEKLALWTQENEETLTDMQMFIKRDCALLDMPAGQVKAISTAVMLGSTQYGQFLKKYFPESDYIRLSVHPHADVSKKLGINLIYGHKGTPWHNAVIIDGKKISLTSRINYSDWQDPEPGMHDLHNWNSLAFLRNATLIMTRSGY